MRNRVQIVTRRLEVLLGRLKAGIRLNEARTEEAFNQYQSTALNAFREVEQALAAEQWLKEYHDPQKLITELICEACTSRFRPIFLAFLTNFAGFLPALLETSPQAQFLIPMTLSLSAGLLLGMAASLILTPVCYAILGKA